MTIYAWPAAWVPRRFNMYIKPNERAFEGYYAGGSQVLDLLGESWRASIELPAGNDEDRGAAMEAFFNRLRGRANLIALWNMKRPVPRGSMRGTPTISGAVSALASVINIQSTAGATLNAGDLIGVAGQVSQVMAPITANGSGLFSGVEIFPRARVAIANGASVQWDKPTVNFRLDNGDGVPVDWLPGDIYEALAIKLVEV